MSVSTNIPQISALKAAVEKIIGTPIRTHDGFITLVGEIESALSEHISESTLERIWGYSTRKTEAVSLRTLDVLSQYVGAASWDDFCIRLKEDSGVESEELRRASIVTDDLPSGTRLQIGWLPDRIIKVEYCGQYEFSILESVNSSLKAGDRFKCLQFKKGCPLYLDCFRRAGDDKVHSYVAGERGGITLLEKL